MKKRLLLIAMLSLLVACSSGEYGDASYLDDNNIIYVDANHPAGKGTADYVYEPPIVDVVTVPPGLDPEGIYYRPAHEEVVEIRQGRWRYKND